VREASEAWREEADPLGDFVAARCVIGDQCKVRAGDLFAAYVSWCEALGMKERERMTQTAFGRRIAARFEKQQRAYIGGVQGPAYFGVGLRQGDGEQVE
jgi:phage/plasmid-associated DNA primase